MTDKEVMRQALAYVRWQAFGECRNVEWQGPPPTSAELDAALVAAIAQPVQPVEPVNDAGYVRLREAAEKVDAKAHWINDEQALVEYTEMMELRSALAQPVQPEQFEQPVTQNFAYICQGCGGIYWAKVTCDCNTKEAFDLVAVSNITQPVQPVQAANALSARLADLHLYEEVAEHYAKCNASPEALRDWVIEHSAQPVPPALDIHSCSHNCMRPQCVRERVMRR